MAGSLDDFGRGQTEGNPVQRKEGRDTDYVARSLSGRWRAWDWFQSYSWGSSMARRQIKAKEKTPTQVSSFGVSGADAIR